MNGLGAAAALVLGACLVASTVHGEMHPTLANATAFETELLTAGLVVDGGAAQAQLDEILTRLTPDGATAPVRARVLRHEAADAFALPNGAIYVCTGLLDALPDETERAAVIAHELAHVLGRHALRRAHDFDLARRTLRLPPAALAAWRVSYERALEAEAERVAAVLMRRAGYEVTSRSSASRPASMAEGILGGVDEEMGF